MDTQIKIIVNAEYADNNIYTTTFYDMKTYSLTKPIVFNEYVKNGVSILIEAPRHYYIAIDVPYMQDKIYAFPNKERTYFIPKESKGIVPGTFEIALFHGNENIAKFYYTITPTSGNYDDILNLREYLETIAHGLTKDTSVIGRAPINNGNLTSENSLDKLEFLYRNYDKISRYIDKIIINPICNIEKETKISSKIKTVSSKSIRYLNQHSHNYNLASTEHMLQNVSVISYDNNENRILKAIFIKMLEEVSKIESDVYSKVLNLKNIKDKIENDLVIKEKNKDIYRSKFGYKNLTNTIITSIRTLTLEKQNIATKINTLEDNFHNVKTLKLLFAKILNRSFLSNLTANYKIALSNKVVKSPEYYFIYDMYFKIIENKNISSTQISNSYQFKPTDKLVEYYCIDLIINILINNFNFKWKSGWLADKSRIDNEMEPESLLVFERDNFKIHLWYDHIVPYYKKVMPEYDGLVTKKVNTNNRPDILMEIYDKTDNRLKSYVVFECKHRKINYIYNDDDYENSNDVQEQLSEYDNFISYLDIKNPIARQVVCLYTLGENSIIADDPLLNFVGIKFSRQIEETIGYPEIVDILKPFIL